MINEVGLFLASSVISSGGAIGDALNQAAEAGFFAYILPFLLIFALVFGILSSIQIFKDNKAVEAIIALAVALMSLQFDMVPIFFSQVFPRLGIGLAVILVILILAGFFIDPSRGWIMYTLLAVGAITAMVVLVSTAGEVGFPMSYMIYNNIGTIFAIGFVIVVLAIIIGATNKKPSTPYALGPFRS